MGTALIYLLVVIAVAAAVFGLAAVVFGRGEQLPALPPGATPTRLPAEAIEGRDVRELRFPQALRGYRMAEVDWVLERLAVELDRADAERRALLARLAGLEADGDRRSAGQQPEPAEPGRSQGRGAAEAGPDRRAVRGAEPRTGQARGGAGG